jgi:hypothetical protein
LKHLLSRRYKPLARQMPSVKEENQTQVKAHNNLATWLRLRKQRSLTERQFFRMATGFQEDTMTKQETLYAKFEGFEEQIAHCYFMLHERFIANPPLARFWAEAAMDELQHCSILRFCRERKLMPDVNLDPKVAEHVEQLLATVKGLAADPEVSIEEAFYASLLMESSELDETYEKLTAGLAKDHPLLYEAIHSSLRSHHGAFADAAEQFSLDRGFAEAFKNLRRNVS